VISRGSGDIINNVMVCSGTLHALLQYRDCTSLIATPNKVKSSLSWTVKISNYSATCINDHLYSKITFLMQLLIWIAVNFPRQVAYTVIANFLEQLCKVDYELNYICWCEHPPLFFIFCNIDSKITIFSYIW